jgi:hypothetical protein
MRSTTTTRSDTGRALQYALAFTGLGMVLLAAAFVAGAGDAGTATAALLIVALLVLALVQGVLVAGLRSEAERVRRAVEGA